MDLLKLSPKEAGFLMLLIGQPVLDKLNHQDTAESATAVAGAYSVQVNGALAAMARDVGDMRRDLNDLNRACGLVK